MEQSGEDWSRGRYTAVADEMIRSRVPASGAGRICHADTDNTERQTQRERDSRQEGRENTWNHNNDDI